MDGRVAVLASGAGSNLEALLADEEVGPAIVLVVTDRPGAGALDRARVAGVAAEVVDRSAHSTRDGFDRGLLERLRAHDVDALVLAGFMRILGPEIVRAFANRILNVHPSLLPAFPGAHAVRDTLAWGARVTGCTVHLVDEEVDHGPIVFQEAVPVVPGDDEASLHARIKQAEHRLLPQAVRLLIAGRIDVEGRSVRILPAAEAAEVVRP